ncbi:MAG: hypothetical protein J0H40_14580 [Rhizobiales bacterium]|nr:hypothetical protein [Hyphomicrobiales bacterium]
MSTRAIAGAIISFVLTIFCTSSLYASPCITPSLTEAALNQFKADPQSLLAPTSDTRNIEATVRDLAGTDASLAAILVHLAEKTNPRFRTAIAAGLAQAAVACQGVDQEAALLIQQAVAAVQDGELQNSFAAVAGDLSTAATAAAAGAATSSAGSVAVTNPNSSSGLTPPASGGGSLAFFQITSGGIATLDRSTTTTANTATAPNTTTAADPVSPTR